MAEHAAYAPARSVRHQTDALHRQAQAAAMTHEDEMTALRARIASAEAERDTWRAA
jgi:hypothetical protein